MKTDERVTTQASRWLAVVRATALGVNLNVPVSAERRLDFHAPPGTYEFVCAIPGHAQAGMEGTLRVR